MPDVPMDYLWQVARNPIQFPKAIRGLENGRGCMYLDLGPGGTLANFAKRNLAGDSRSESHAIMTLFHQDMKNLDKIKGLFPAKTAF
jgi:acyl transferase domain-containing protein